MGITRMFSMLTLKKLVLTECSRFELINIFPKWVLPKEDGLKEERKTEEFCFITHGFVGLRRAGRRFVD